MDGLDIYIDDYSKPSPLSVADMAKMVGAQFLKLVEDPNDKPAPVAASLPGQNHQPAEDTAQTDTTTGEPAVNPEDAQTEAPPLLASAADPSEPNDSQDDHADLQLQPDHAPGPPRPWARRWMKT
jgi:hypothetical protein